ncbi:type I restriction endonuclease subunit R [Tenacibaculum finnmarkense]|uniref:type I restriction endonuclease subunit R n=1 Tax=Tenacibaculum finnmarkense TaxID=2781243 RepID=UPI001E331408|nr:HsdR family type I site-specific deoxyribonuclease [Tenacibaculum finnmarkense]MCD8402075.1 HsdR family type I site-specific deoxyribonuclease [Tenacibaculum finnmarkense genomovar finnmarkense]
MFKNEAEFEKTFIETLRNFGDWNDSEVLKNPTEQDLLNNWAKILYKNNKSIDRLNEKPLTNGEMQQIVAQINTLRTPLNLNGFIKGKTISIKRDNKDDKLHFGKEISLKIYDPYEIGQGQSKYQIAQQPQFPTKSKMLNNRRGDVMLLINGMPLIHIELKKSGVSVTQATHQIENYARSGIFTGFFSLVQIFVAMNPEEAVYFANPGPDGKFNSDYYFNWADFNNVKINNWKNFSRKLLTVPIVHELVGLYTIADKSDGILKVMRSYQYHACHAISDKVAKTNWNIHDKTNHLGGFIWHTTGSGKTLTSFKSAQLIANSKDADKVIFLMDRIELGTQSLKAYNHFTEDNEEVQATEDTQVLINKLKSNDPANTLIVSSIQKMSNITEDGLRSADISKINQKRMVIIVDEAHRSTFGDMLQTIKQTFDNALFFGFTGTPILDENQKKDSTTTTVFGQELHRYTLTDGITDKNVLGFDPYKVLTYKDKDLRLEVALEKSKSENITDAMADPKRKKIFNKYMNDVPMAGYLDENSVYNVGIEDLLPKSQYQTENYYNAVVKDILEGWKVLSQDNKFHAIFATSSIADAIMYYRKFKSEASHLNVTALFDATIDNNGSAPFKEDGLVELMEDYNAKFGQNFTLATHGKFKKDIALRLAHKTPYQRITTSPEKQLDILIVVDQMLTGFDSKWVNTLYLDKMLKYENLIQAISRTNRLFGEDKPFGTIKYYKLPHTMERNINDAVKLYSGDKPLELFVDKLDKNLIALNDVFTEIKELFENAKIESFSKLPTEKAERGLFAKLFNTFNHYFESAKVQGFRWDKLNYTFEEKNLKIEIRFDKQIFLTLVQRYKELFSNSDTDEKDSDIPFDIKTHITEIDTGKIDSDFMNSKFKKFLKNLESSEISKTEKEKTLNELRKSYAKLSQNEQKYAEIFLRDIERGDVVLEQDKDFMDYIVIYHQNDENDKIKQISIAFGLEESLLRGMINTEFSMAKFNRLKETVDKEKAKIYFEKLEGVKISKPNVNIKTHNLLKEFIVEQN